MTLQIGYWIALCALVLIISVKGCWQMKRSVFALLGVGIVSLILASVIDWTTPPYGLAMMAVNFAGAWVILWRPAGKIQSLLGITLVLQMGVHAGKLLRGADSNLDYYYTALSVLAILQLVLIGGWWCREWFTWHDRIPDRSAVPVPAHRKGVG